MDDGNEYWLTLRIDHNLIDVMWNLRCILDHYMRMHRTASPENMAGIIEAAGFNAWSAEE